MQAAAIKVMGVLADRDAPESTDFLHYMLFQYRDEMPLHRLKNFAISCGASVTDFTDYEELRSQGFCNWYAPMENHQPAKRAVLTAMARQLPRLRRENIALANEFLTAQISVLSADHFTLELCFACFCKIASLIEVSGVMAVVISMLNTRS